ncbi:uncharacterized protein F4807DRAFT_7292 [Annulohypoxylon truncatum]|uniref:uncharacterized protein n=1 Tax=Annulohypoxylon truncatum TaxID=327061 RepID=UPI00200820D5|nr:uncharacterized protein F4807DRAFT_7292 [Annulohypoxylon truncatum]KAI1214737.1 hypothetical protein F4807DRAFT_7292 [Annulohypoxylon truncatum]
MPFQNPLVLSLTALTVTLIIMVWRKLCPTPCPGIPYNQKSAGRITGDIPDPELKAQKRLWADVMGSEFLHKAAAPNIYKATLELLDLWQLKASTVYRVQPFSVHEDFQNAALDAIWVAVVGEEPGVTRHEIHTLRSQNAGYTNTDNGASLSEPPRGIFLMEEVAYIADTIASRRA